MNWRSIRPPAMFLFAALLFLGIGAIAPAAYADGTISACGAVIPSTATGTWTVTKNLAGTSSVPCITVSANGVAINLNGHIITGPGAGVGITDGGSCSPICQYNIIIANGTIKGFTEGILLDYTEYATISNMNVTENTFGIAVDQDHAVVTGSWANNNASIGIFLEDDDETVSNSQANNNGIIGIYLDGANTTVSNSQANNNRVYGIQFSINNATVSNSQANSNGYYGMIFSGDNNIVTNSQANASQAINNFVGGGMIFNGVFGGNTVSNSQANGNKGNGILFYMNYGNSVTATTANGNSSQGIAITCPSNLYGNIVSGNAGGNIVTSGTGCARLGNNPGP